MKEFKINVLALSIAVFGPLINFFLKPYYSSFIISSYLYWAILLSIYIAVLIPFVSRSFLRLSRLVIIGITVEDFSSNIWNSLLTGKNFLPFYNWYSQYFPFFNILGEPTPYLLIPIWYLFALAIYFALTAVQYRKQLLSLLKPKFYKRRSEEK
jgi:hypothetical protein